MVEETYIRELDQWRGLTSGTLIPATPLEPPEQNLGLVPLGDAPLGG